MNKLIAALLIVSGLAFGIAHNVHATPDVCEPLDSGKIDTVGDPASVTVTAPAGKVIIGYCAKAGSAQSGGGPEYFRVKPTTTLVIAHSSGKDLSHYSVRYGDSPKPTTTTSSTTTTSTTTTTEPVVTINTVPTTTTTETSAPTTQPTTTEMTTTTYADHPTTLPPTQHRELPETGNELGLAALAAALLAGGTGLVLATRRS